LHPDFYLNSTSQEKRLSERASTLLNQAYDTLKDPFKRADYLMSLKCKNVKWNDRVLPPTFLQEMFTLQEELDEMLENQDQQGLLKMREVLENRFQDLESGMLPSFRTLDSVEEPETVLEKIQMDLNAERYLRRLLDRIKIEETT
ncbi:MAG: Fe-S protein assembly co-chaperone HscB, partial [SAR324 cluster bacterium]|nr:Fe-S protein assembly co-chaperone HscB [SAR324 cluster bacterium]